MKAKTFAPWSEAERRTAWIDDHYGIKDDEREAMYGLALQVPTGGLIVEIGVCHGRTASVLAFAAQQVGADYHGIDTFSLEGDEAEFRATMAHQGHPYTLHVGGSSGPAPINQAEIAWRPSQPINLLLIDGDHAPLGVEADCRKWLPLIAPGGLVAFDDWDGVTAEEAWAHRDGQPDHNPHWGIAWFGTQYTAGWEDLGFVGKIKLKRRR